MAIELTKLSGKLHRSIERMSREGRLVTVSRCLVLKTAIDTFCTKCKFGEGQQSKITLRIKQCTNDECPLHPVRSGSKATGTLSTMSNLLIVAERQRNKRDIHLKVGWTHEEEMELLNLKASGHTIRKIAMLMNRSVESVRQRLELLRLAQRADKRLIDGEATQE